MDAVKEADRDIFGGRSYPPSGPRWLVAYWQNDYETRLKHDEVRIDHRRIQRHWR